MTILTDQNVQKRMLIQEFTECLDLEIVVEPIYD